ICVGKGTYGSGAGAVKRACEPGTEPVRPPRPRAGTRARKQGMCQDTSGHATGRHPGGPGCRPDVTRGDGAPRRYLVVLGGVIGDAAIDCGETELAYADGGATAAAGSGPGAASTGAVAPPTMRMPASSKARLMRQRSSRSTVRDLPGIVFADTRTTIESSSTES